MVELRRGLDKVLVFTLDDTKGEISECKVIFAQKGKVILSKVWSKNNLPKSGDALSVSLTAGETKLFTPNMAAVVQILVKYDGGGTDWSEKDRILVLDTLGGVTI